jgi:uncharacterized protein (TIGR02679 family)
MLNDPDPGQLAVDACSVLSRLPQPGERIDRRTLVPGHPHALDDGRTLAGLVQALTGVNGRRSRAAWNVLGVDCDDLIGGLICLGMRPQGWSAPADAVLTIPPRELARIRWEPPHQAGAWAFVTENPSVLAAATAIAAAADGPGAAGTVHLLCTAGTPSDIETAGIGALTDAGWQIAVRADFDAAGLAHMRAILAAAPRASPWRMSAADYLDCSAADSSGVDVGTDDAPWNPELAAQMSTGGPRYEEDLLPELLHDLRAGAPRSK